MLKKALQNSGIEFLSQNIESTEKKLLFETPSLFTLREFIEPMNCWSDNFRAELLALCLTRKICGKADYSLLDKTLKKIFNRQGLKLPGLLAADGSGLSRKNRISAADITTLLDKMYNFELAEDFKNSLAVAGRKGTLRKRFKDSFFEGKLHAKTGTLNSVSSLSGYFSHNNKDYSFSLICNGVDNQHIWQALEKFSDALYFLQ